MFCLHVTVTITENTEQSTLMTDHEGTTPPLLMDQENHRSQK